MSIFLIKIETKRYFIKESLLAPDLSSRYIGPNRILHVTGYKKVASLKIGKGRTGAMPKIDSENQFLAQIKGHNSLLCTYLSKFTHLQSQDTP